MLNKAGVYVHTHHREVSCKYASMGEQEILDDRGGGRVEGRMENAFLLSKWSDTVTPPQLWLDAVS